MITQLQDSAQVSLPLLPAPLISFFAVSIFVFKLIIKLIDEL